MAPDSGLRTDGGSGGEDAEKGDAVLVEGRIASRAFRDKDGNDRAVTEIVVAGWQGTVNILSGRRAPDGSRDVEEGGGAPESPE